MSLPSFPLAVLALNGKGTKVPGQVGPDIDTESERAGQALSSCQP